MNNTARRYKLPAWLLWGVFGAESSFGKSTNWFGLVAVPRSTYGVAADGNHYDSGGKPTFSGDADQAGKTLRRLIDESNGNLEAALGHYSGNDYAKVAAQHGFKSATAYLASLAKQAPTQVDVPKTLIQDIATGPVGDAAAGAVSAAEALGRIATLLTSTEFWLRLGEAIAGLLLVAMGLRSLTGQATTPATVLRAARKAI